MKISDLIIHDDEQRDPNEYGDRVMACSPAQREYAMDVIDIYGTERVTVSSVRASTVVVESPESKMSSRMRRVRLDWHGVVIVRETDI